MLSICSLSTSKKAKLIEGTQIKNKKDKNGFFFIKKKYQRLPWNLSNLVIMIFIFVFKIAVFNQINKFALAQINLSISIQPVICICIIQNS